MNEPLIYRSTVNPKRNKKRMIVNFFPQSFL